MGISALLSLVMNCSKYNCIFLSLSFFLSSSPSLSLSVSLFWYCLHTVTTTIPATVFRPEIKRSFFLYEAHIRILLRFAPSLSHAFSDVMSVSDRYNTDSDGDRASLLAYMNNTIIRLTRPYFLYNIKHFADGHSRSGP